MKTKQLLRLSCAVLTGLVGVTAWGRPAITSLDIDDRHGSNITFQTNGMSDFVFFSIPTGIAGVEEVVFAGQSVNPFATSNSGAALLTEPGDPTAISDVLIMQWDISGLFEGIFLSVNPANSVLLGPNDPSWVSYPETGFPVNIAAFGFDDFFTGGPGDTAPFPITVASSIPDAGSTAALLGLGLASVHYFRRRK